jgi:hypothetical protein
VRNVRSPWKRIRGQSLPSAASGRLGSQTHAAETAPKRAGSDRDLQAQGAEQRASRRVRECQWRPGRTRRHGVREQVQTLRRSGGGRVYEGSARMRTSDNGFGGESTAGRLVRASRGVASIGLAAVGEWLLLLRCEDRRRGCVRQAGRHVAAGGTRGRRTWLLCHGEDMGRATADGRRQTADSRPQRKKDAVGALVAAARLGRRADLSLCSSRSHPEVLTPAPSLS